MLGLAVILSYLSIRDLLNSCPINSDPWSYVISIGLGYLDIHVVSTKFAIDIALLSLYSDISIHLVTGQIIITAFRFKVSSCHFLIFP